MQFVSHLSSIAPDFDALLLDLWGCVHDGTNLYPDALYCIEQAYKAGKRIIFLSNAPRRATKAQAVLDQLGVSSSLYTTIVTSGEVGFQALKTGALNFGTAYYFVGAPHDASVLHGLDCVRVDNIAQAEFILNCGFGTEGQSSEDISGLLADAAARSLPMLCLNPDLEVVKITGERFLCAGVIARDYIMLGGKVQYFGKPYPQVYDYSMHLLAPTPRTRILAIGDSLHTDVLGANNAHIASTLVTGGILKQTFHGKSEAEIEAFLLSQDTHPTYVIPALRW